MEKTLLLIVESSANEQRKERERRTGNELLVPRVFSSASRVFRCLARLPRMPRCLAASLPRTLCIPLDPTLFSTWLLLILWFRKHSLLLVECTHWHEVDFRRSLDRKILESLLHTLGRSTRPHRPQVRKEHFNTKNYSWLDGLLKSLEDTLLKMLVSRRDISLQDHCWTLFWQFRAWESIANVELGKYGKRINFNVQEGSEMRRVKLWNAVSKMTCSRSRF